MAETVKNRVADDPQATLDIINTIERTSKKELDVLLSIDKKLSDTSGRVGGRASGNPKPDHPPAREQGNEQKNSPHKRRASGAKTPLTREERDDGLRVSRRKSRQTTTSQIEQKNSPHKESQVTTERKHPQKPEHKSPDTAPTTTSAAAKVPEASTPKPRTYADQVRKRDGNGRFTSSADKARQKHQDDQHDELVDEEKKSRTIFNKLTGFITKKDPKEMEGTALDAAGAAAGGSFWKAGKEAMELVKNTGEMLGIGKDDDEKKKKSLLGRVKGLFGKEKKKLPAAVAPAENDYTPSLSKRNGAPAILRATASPTVVGGFGLRNATRARASASSLDVTNRNVQKAAVDKTEEQTQVIKEGDAQIVERLDELLEKSGGAKKGGGLLAKLLGAKIAGKLGKALAGIAGLWVAKFGKKLFSALLAVITAASAGFRKSRPGRNPRNVDIDADGRGGQGKNKPKKNKPSGKSKGNIFKKLLTNPTVTTAATAVAATAATGAAVASHSGATPEETTEKGTKPKATPKTATEAAKESAEKARASAPKPGDKVSVGRPLTAEEGVAKKAGQSVATEVAEKGAVEAAEKGGVKAAAKGAAKIGMRSIPILGTAIMTAVDAVDGYSDEEAQREAFQLKDGEEVTTGQKASFSAANVLDMGGLVSGAAGLLADGAEALGMDGVADALKFDTGDMAKGINSAATSAKDAITNLFTDKSDSKSESQTKTITDSIKEGAKDTINALEATSQRLIDTLKDNPLGDAEVIPLKGVGVSSPGPAVSTMQGPSETTMTPDLNVGGRLAKVRSFRNNNFGNIKFANQPGAVLEKKNSLGEQTFARWNTPEEGMRGTANQIMLYQTGKSRWGKLETLDAMFDKFAPSSQNNTEQYKRSLESQLGISRHDKVDWSDPNKMRPLVRAIGTVEGGGAIQMSDADMAKALGHYNFETNLWEGEFTAQSLESNGSVPTRYQYINL